MSPEAGKARRPAVLTDIPGKVGGFWGENTVCIDLPRLRRAALRGLGRTWGARVHGLAVGLRLFLAQWGYRGLVTGGEPASLVLAALQWAVPVRRVPHVMIVQLYRPRSRLAYGWKRLQMAMAARSVRWFVVWASHEVEDYARVLGLPRERIRYVPFHHTLGSYRFTVTAGDYLFSGGNYDRDYPMLVEAVRDLGIPVWIAATRTEWLQGVDLPSHVRVEGTSHEGFRQAMAGARAVVVAMQGGLLHSGGQQTLLNAMVMGKPVIAVGRRWARDLMRDGEHGRIVDYGDVAGLRAAIRWIWDHPREAEEMGRRGREHALPFTTRRTMEAIHRLALGEPGVGEATGEQIPQAGSGGTGGG